MEVSGTVLRRSPAVFGGGIGREGGRLPFSVALAAGAGRRARVSARPRSFPAPGGGGFSDEGHLRYYASPTRCGGGKEEKRRAKLVKGLTRDLSALEAMGIGLDAGEWATGEVKGKKIAEAAELLLAQLNQLKAQAKETKRKRKEEKAAMKAAAARNDCAEDDTSSSSSSQSSSDSDCEEVMEMGGGLGIAALPSPRASTLADPEEAPEPIARLGQECSSSSIGVVEKIEVCMGGKCKKSGAPEILEEFRRKVGIEGAVGGCKCMGKCKDGPNVRVVNACKEKGSVETLKNPLCIGVGVGDVDRLMVEFLADNQGLGLMAV